MSSPMQRQSVTVIIPAHNEEQALPSTLTSLMDQDFAGHLRIVVVPNGCDDRTAEVARSFTAKARERGFELLVAELSEGCKPKALNHGDLQVIPDSIRIYLDADIRLSPNAISAVARELRDGTGIHCAAPRIQVAPAKSLITRAYLKVWLNTPYIRTDVICGFYGVSAEGRRRWDKFPIIIADDKFTRMQFARRERKVAQDATMTIQYAEGLSELIKVRTRWTRGNIELAMVYPQLWKRDEGRYTRTVPHLLSKPSVWPSIPVFGLVYAWGWWVAFKTRKANLSTWERSNGSRAALATG
jgi:cellulose synthase/poly-beta-1,6-N-acetylglucosamine synthase-like glycosyltransferase